MSWMDGRVQLRKKEEDKRRVGIREQYKVAHHVKENDDSAVRETGMGFD